MQKKAIKLSKQKHKSMYEYKTNNNMVDIYSNISVTRLNVNGLKTLIKGQRLWDQIKTIAAAITTATFFFILF